MSAFNFGNVFYFWGYEALYTLRVYFSCSSAFFTVAWQWKCFEI